MLNRFSLLSRRWCAQPTRCRATLYLLLFSCIFIIEVSAALLRPVMDEIALCVEYSKKEQTLTQIGQEIQQAETAQTLLTQYQQRLPKELELGSSISLYQSQLMSLLQQQIQEAHIQDPDIQLRDCYSSKEKRGTSYCDLFVVLNASRSQLVPVMKRILTHPWLMRIKHSRFKPTAENLLHAQLHLSFVFLHSSSPQGYPFSTYISGLEQVPITPNTAHLKLSFFPDTQQQIAPSRLAQLQPEMALSRPPLSLGEWRYNGLVKSTEQSMAHLSHKEHTDLWLHKDTTLIDSHWRLKEIHPEVLIFVHDISHQVARVSYSGEIL